MKLKMRLRFTSELVWGDRRLLRRCCFSALGGRLQSFLTGWVQWACDRSVGKDNGPRRRAGVCLQWTLVWALIPRRIPLLPVGHVWRRSCRGRCAAFRAHLLQWSGWAHSLHLWRLWLLSAFSGVLEACVASSVKPWPSEAGCLRVKSCSAELCYHLSFDLKPLSKEWLMATADHIWHTFFFALDRIS